MRYELSDYEWAAIKPMLPNKPRGVPRVNDRSERATKNRPQE
jgi:transposase